MTDEEILAQRVVIYVSFPIIERDGKRFFRVVLFGRPEEIPLPDDADRGLSRAAPAGFRAKSIRVKQRN